MVATTAAVIGSPDGPPRAERHIGGGIILSRDGPSIGSADSYG